MLSIFRAIGSMILAVVITAWSSAAVWADFEKGADAYKRGDYAAAFVEWKPLAERGDSDAQFNLGLMYRDGQGTPKNRVEAQKWFRLAVNGYRQAAEKGDTYAMSAFGFMYEMGLGVSGNDAEAMKWYRKAAEHGNAHAQYMIGFKYELERNYAEALKWYRKAGIQGDTSAQFELGFMYENGEGVTKDYREAATWYHRAAEQGHLPSMYNLGIMYSKGRGVSPDPVKAYMWLSLAGKMRMNINMESDKTRNILLWQSMQLASPAELKRRAENELKRVKEKMTHAQIAEAQRLAQEWLKKKE